MTNAEAYAKVREKIALRFGSNVAEEIFSEFEESDDEKIRKEMLNVFKQLDECTTICGRNYGYAKWIAWLEKQECTSLVEEMKRRKDLLLHEKEKAVSSTDRLSLGGRIAMLDELLVFANEKQGGQKPAWSEDDEKMSENLLSHLREYYVQKKGYPYIADLNSPEMKEFWWFKTLKKRLKGEQT